MLNENVAYWIQKVASYISEVCKDRRKLVLMRRLIVFFVLVASASARVGEVQTRHRKLFVADNGRAIFGRYIVVLNPKVNNVLSVAKSLLENTGATIEYQYDAALKGFAVSGLVATVLDLLLDDDIVEYVEEDQYITEDQSIQTQSYPSNWALDRIDAPNLPMNNKYQYRYTGKGVTIFVLDTGVNLNHAEYSGRVQCGYSAIYGEDCTDFRGHGSHVTGIAAGSSVGVAKGASIYSVKVLDKDGNGSVSGVIAGINYVTKQKQNNPSYPMLASKFSIGCLLIAKLSVCWKIFTHGNNLADMSLGGSKSTSINNAAAAAVANGVVVVTSAGNDSSYACNKSPASAESVITIAATNTDDSRGSYSNYGVCVDLFA